MFTIAIFTQIAQYHGESSSLRRLGLFTRKNTNTPLQFISLSIVQVAFAFAVPALVINVMLVAISLSLQYRLLSLLCGR